MTEQEIRLDQTKKVFDVIAKLIKENETCTYRYLIYDLLGFEEGAYIPLINGLTITNMLVDYQDDKEKINKAIEYIKHTQNYGTIAQIMPHLKPYINGDDLLEILQGGDNE